VDGPDTLGKCSGEVRLSGSDPDPLATYVRILCKANRLHVIYREHEHQQVRQTNRDLGSSLPINRLVV
jgi:hypothetical protein